MYNRKVRFFAGSSAVLILLFFMASTAHAHDLVWPGEKLKVLFPQAQSFEQKNLYVSDEQRSAIERALGTKLPEEDLKPSIYFVIVKDRPEGPSRRAGAIIFIDAYGKGGKIEMGVVVSGRGDLLRVHLFDNKEPEALSQPSFLKQFEGKKAAEPFIIGSDLNAPKGTEKSAQAVASGARRGLLIISELFRKR